MSHCNYWIWNILSGKCSSRNPESRWNIEVCETSLNSGIWFMRLQWLFWKSTAEWKQERKRGKNNFGKTCMKKVIRNLCMDFATIWKLAHLFLEKKRKYLRKTGLNEYANSKGKDFVKLWRKSRWSFLVNKLSWPNKLGTHTKTLRYRTHT